MSLAIRLGTFTAKVLKRLNYWRLYYQVLLVSDIVTMDERSVDFAYTVGEIPTCGATSEWLHVNAPKPCKSSLGVRNRFCTKMLLPKYPLECRVLPPSQLRNMWPAYFDFDSGGSGIFLRKSATELFVYYV